MRQFWSTPTRAFSWRVLLDTRASQSHRHVGLSPLKQRVKSRETSRGARRRWGAGARQTRGDVRVKKAGETVLSSQSLGVLDNEKEEEAAPPIKYHQRRTRLSEAHASSLVKQAARVAGHMSSARATSPDRCRALFHPVVAWSSHSAQNHWSNVPTMLQFLRLLTDSLGLGPIPFLLDCAIVHASVEFRQRRSISSPPCPRVAHQILASQLLRDIHAGAPVDTNLKATALKTMLPTFFLRPTPAFRR